MLNRIRPASGVSSSTMSNTQRVAVVTGANKGIGFAIVRALCKQLDNGIVYLTARNEERGREAVAKLNKEGLQPKFHQLDVTHPASVSKLRDFLTETHGGLDILVNNAGVYYEEGSSLPLGEKASVTMAINFDAALDVSRALIPLIRAHGRIVNVSSLVGVWAFQKMSKELQGRFQGAKTEQEVEQLMHEFVTLAKAGSHAREGWPEMVYGISKMGIIALTRIQADDIAKDKTKGDVLLTCCCPGCVAADVTNCRGRGTVGGGAVAPVCCALLPPGSGRFGGGMFGGGRLVGFWWRPSGGFSSSSSWTLGRGDFWTFVRRCFSGGSPET